MTWQEIWDDGVASIREMPVATRTERHSAILAADEEIKRLREAVIATLNEDLILNHLLSPTRDALLEAIGEDIGPWTTEKEARIRRRAGMEGK